MWTWSVFGLLLTACRCQAQTSLSLSSFCLSLPLSPLFFYTHVLYMQPFLSFIQWVFHFFPFSRCERLTCEVTQDPASCFLLPLRISFYNISFPTNTPIPADVFRMGPSNFVPGDNMQINIVSGDEEGYFLVQQHAHGGEISLRRTLTQPRDFILTVEMRLIRYGMAHLYMAKIAVFVTHEQPIWPSRTFPY